MNMINVLQLFSMVIFVGHLCFAGNSEGLKGYALMDKIQTHHAYFGSYVDSDNNYDFISQKNALIGTISKKWSEAKYQAKLWEGAKDPGSVLNNVPFFEHKIRALLVALKRNELKNQPERYYKRTAESFPATDKGKEKEFVTNNNLTETSGVPSVYVSNVEPIIEFKAWEKMFASLPINCVSSANSHSELDYVTFSNIFDTYFTVIQNDSLLNDSSNWAGGDMPPDLAASLHATQSPTFVPYVQKLILDSENIVALHGDFHGALHSFLAFIKKLADDGLMDSENSFKIANPKLRILFLGDFTDRGNYGIQVLSTAMLLKIFNPHQVFLVRGNHEDISMNGHFLYQVAQTFRINKDDVILKKIEKLYNTMPLALYLGARKDGTKTKYALCCHGGIEIGFDAKKFLKTTSALNIAFQYVKKIDRQMQLDKIKNNQKLLNIFINAHKSVKSFDNLLDSIYAHGALSPVHWQPFIPTGIKTTVRTNDGDPMTIILSNFQWADYDVEPESGGVWNPCFVKNNCCGTGARGWIIGKIFNTVALKLQSSKNHQLCATFRAHQHSGPMMELILASGGVARLWRALDDNKSMNVPLSLQKNDVYTFNVSPDTPYSVVKGDDKPLFSYDTYGILTLAKRFKDWKLQVHRTAILNSQATHSITEEMNVQPPIVNPEKKLPLFEEKQYLFGGNNQQPTDKRKIPMNTSIIPDESSPSLEEESGDDSDDESDEGTEFNDWSWVVASVFDDWHMVN